MSKSNPNYQNEWGILIHQLPMEFMGRATEVLSEALTGKMQYKSFDKLGMRVYFSRKEDCDKLILKKHIELHGILFNIYSTVTCLTVYSINAVATREIIRTYFRAKDLPVYDLYQITYTDDYRIILDVPEVSANLKDFKISLDSNPGSMFPMDFYCRVCRTVGHKQYQCLSRNSTPSFMENYGAGNSGAEIERAHLNITGKQRNASVTGSHNTKDQKKDIRNSGNVSVRDNAYLPETEPRTSSTPTAAECLMRTPHYMTTGRNRSSQKTARTKRKRSRKDVKKRRTKRQFPCPEIMENIPKTRGILSHAHLRSFLETVYCKHLPNMYAKVFTLKIPGLIQQIRDLISICKQQGLSSTATEDIKILEGLCERLRR